VDSADETAADAQNAVAALLPNNLPLVKAA